MPNSLIGRTIIMAKKILLVDDDVDFVVPNQKLLEQAGYEVVTANSEKEATAMIEKSLPDLAIVDLMLENSDSGFTLAYHIKKFDKKIPVVLVTSVMHDYGFDFKVETGEERNWVKADILVDKPIRFEQLLNDIKRLLKD
jgi:two-component system, OmpR family, response regulator